MASLMDHATNSMSKENTSNLLYIRLPVVDTEAGLQIFERGEREARGVALVALLLSLAGNQGEGRAYLIHARAAQM
jgi:hypothetical protein